MSTDFAIAWSEVRDDVYACCLRASGGNVALANEAFQATAQRLRRGYSSFQNADQFLPWAQVHARAEVCRLVFAQMEAPRSRDAMNPGTAWLETAAAAAVAENWLSPSDARLLLAGAAKSGVDWNKVGGEESLPPARAAARHARIASRLWVFLFTRRPEMLGSTVMLRDACERAMNDPQDPLTISQAALFRAVVIDEPSSNPRPPGWREDLAAACERVIRFLPLP